MMNVKQRMAEDMKLRGLAPRTQHSYATQKLLIDTMNVAGYEV